jgi:hypothetical protein
MRGRIASQRRKIERDLDFESRIYKQRQTRQVVDVSHLDTVFFLNNEAFELRDSPKRTEFF